ncbi:MAG: hypothetical protein ACHQUB_01775 [Candidatus Saccharimonadia bacterium]
MWEVTRLIKREVRRRGRETLRALDPTKYYLVEHPKYGLCEIDRIGEQTLKVTLLVIDTNRKIVIDAMFLADCKLHD